MSSQKESHTSTMQQNFPDVVFNEGSFSIVICRFTVSVSIQIIIFSSRTTHLTAFC